jgi:uncharacterized protein YhaN
MRIQRLDLLAFGPFTDRSLALEGGQYGLHLVLGPNEAGKSTTLRALRQWLYGIPHNSADNFLHPYPKMRIGGLLVSDSGQPLEFIRRKGRTNTLRGPDDAELFEPARLEALLGRIDETAFAQRFGIDYAELRKGGESIVQGSGELGEVLFAAGAGIADVRHVQSQLESEMQELFTPRGSNPRINQALTGLRKARDAVKQAQLPTTEWKRVDQRLREDIQRQRQIEEHLRDTRLKKSRLERIEQALPKIGRRRLLLTQLAQLADAPLLPDDFAQRRSQVTTGLEHDRKTERQAADKIKHLTREIDALSIPSGLLAHRAAITGLHTRLGSYQKAAADRPRLAMELESSQQQIQAILCDLGHEPDLQQADQLRLTRVQRQRVQSLASACGVLAEKLRQARKAVDKLRAQRQRIESSLDGLSPAQDPRELRQAIRRVQRGGDLDSQLVDLRSQLQESEDRAQIELKRLRLFQGTLSQLQSMPVPLVETVDRFDNAMAESQRSVQQWEQQIAEGAEQRVTTERDMEELRREHDVPSEDDLIAARRQRDQGWQMIREALCDGQAADAKAADAFIAHFAPDRDLADAFQAAQEAADALADRLRREASQVARKAMLTARHLDLTRRVDQHQHARHLAQANLDQLHGDWRELWSPLGIDPKSPREMRAWMIQQKSLAELAGSIDRQRQKLQQTIEMMEASRSDLNQELQRLDQPGKSSPATLAELLELSEQVANAIEASNQQRANLTEQLQQWNSQFDDAWQQAAQAENDLDEWQSQWAEAVAVLGLQRDAAVGEASTVLEAVEEITNLAEAARKLQQRIQGIDEDAEVYGGEVRKMLAEVAPSLLDRPIDQAIGQLHERLAEASRDKAKREEWQKQLDEQHENHEQARSSIQQLETQLTQLCRQAACASPEELPEAEQRCGQRKDCQRELQTVEQQLVELAAGASLEAFIAEAEPFDLDALRADLQSLADEIEHLDNEKSEVAQQIGESRSELRRMDGGGVAAEASQRAEHFIAQLRGDVEQYVRLRLAASVLQQAIDRFRQSSQGPVLERASGLFTGLTLGSFAGLRSDFDEKGQAVLVGVRPENGMTVPVSGMSDGTCDQLYLALRLALLETYLDGREPIPLVIDDILIMFDDDRAKAALEALASLSKKTQVIFFTHHEHLVRLAQQTIGQELLFLHTLTARQGLK